jgi:cupin 2 domain-containing protein
MNSNLFHNLPKNSQESEIIDQLFTHKNITIERIVSTGQITPKDDPYKQDHDEWVILLKGVAELWVEGRGNLLLNPGDYFFIPAKKPHLVTYTSIDPAAVWLAIHIH